MYSSILTLAAAAIDFDPQSAVSRVEKIAMSTLDDAARTFSGNMLLKMDTQGYERFVLEGGRQTLPRLKGVLMELPIVHLYEGTWQFHEAVEQMAAYGFVPAQIHAVNYDSRDKISLLEVDCLFRRAATDVFTHRDPSSDQRVSR